MKIKIALVLALIMLCNNSTYASETPTTDTLSTLNERIQKILHPEGEAPTPEETTPTTEEVTEEPATEDPYAYNKKNTQTTDTTQKPTNGTTWENGYAQNCPEGAFCDGAPTAPTSDWQNILIMIGGIFGEKSPTAENTNSSGYAGNTDFDTIGTPTQTLPDEFGMVTPTGTTDPLWTDSPQGPDLTNVQLGLLNGIPISANASYMYSYTGAGSFQIAAYVNPLAPEVDAPTKFGVSIKPTIPSVHIAPENQLAEETYTKGGTYTKTFRFSSMEYANGNKPRYGQIVVNVNAKVYEGAATLCSSEDSGCGDNGVISGDEFNTNSNAINSSAGTTTDSGLSDLASKFNSSGSDLLDNLFKDAGSSSANNTNNANNPDWLSDGFENIAENTPTSTIPSDFGSQFATDNNSTVPQNVTPAQQGEELYQNAQDNANLNANNVQEQAQTAENQPTEATTAVEAGGNLFSKVDSLIGNDPTTPGSLTAKFAELTNKASSATDKLAAATGFALKEEKEAKLPGAGRPSSIDTLTDLREMAIRMLNANGMSLADIKAGKQYSPGSAYTDPVDAWNLNRMSSSKAKSQIKTTNQKATTTIE